LSVSAIIRLIVEFTSSFSRRQKRGKGAGSERGSERGSAMPSRATNGCYVGAGGGPFSGISLGGQVPTYNGHIPNGHVSPVGISTIKTNSAPTLRTKLDPLPGSPLHDEKLNPAKLLPPAPIHAFTTTVPMVGKSIANWNSGGTF
jgi:hypothetical protein